MRKRVSKPSARKLNPLRSRGYGGKEMISSCSTKDNRNTRGKRERNVQLSGIACDPSPVVVESRIDDELDAACGSSGSQDSSSSPYAFEERNRCNAAVSGSNKLDERKCSTYRERIPPVMSITMFSMLQPTVLLR